MKKHHLLLAIALLFAANSFAKKTPTLPDGFKQQQTSGISFTENKGQVYDQNYNPRPDVLYGVTTGNMAVHIKTSGLSYQLYRIDSYKDVVDTKTREKRKEIDKQTIYRIDLNWLNCNTHFNQTTDETLQGFNNYYLESCPAGVLNVKSYKGITLNNLYNGIDLHYYEKNKELKHDYIVAPHADYKQIQLQVKGAEVRINTDGSLLLITPLGNAQEGAPIVYQNGRQLKAKWVIKTNAEQSRIISFEIENYNPDYELIIDPITRIWGTYYGGATTDISKHCTTDANGNVFLSGYTNSNATGTIIATTGSHQIVSNGGNYDAFLVKINNNGLRQWGTFYGGSFEDRSYSCATDAAGNVFMVGVTNSNTGSNPIATPGSHQPAFGDVFNSTTDAFIVKFNSNGVRQWGTFYGGWGDDSALSCATDPSGNLYITGGAESTFAIATGGGHQPTKGGGVYDAFLVKFNTNGNRLWGTYYGNGSNDSGFGCATDASGNVYLAGSTYTISTGIASVGSHQSVPGGQSDGFLVKFNSSGARQWGTYYGGQGDDYILSCTADGSGNVYVAGETALNSGTAIASIGSHQATFGGGNGDAFIAKFTSSGVRQWGSFYGSATDDYGTSCVTDINGNVYLTGYTFSNANAVFTTTGSQQLIYGGGGDGFLAKFDANGVRLSGTYYGGTGNERANSCTMDLLGNLFIAGETSSGTSNVISTPGTHQSVFGGGNFYDAYLAKFDACDVAPLQPSVINGPQTTCEGLPTLYNTPPLSGANSYSLLVAGGGIFSAPNNSVLATFYSSGIFTLVASNACGVSPEQTFAVTVNPNPTVTVNSGSICSGQSFTLVPSGAASYSYSAGPIVSPNISGSFIVTGTNTLGCSHSVISQVTVYVTPLVTVSSGTICMGESFTITPSGASSYTIEGGTWVVSPGSTANYTVAGSSIEGCVNTNSVVSTISVNHLPSMSITSSNTTICVGEEAILSANGASNYTFTPGGTGPSITISPTLNTTYTVNGTDANGCSNKIVFVQDVSECIGMEELSNTIYKIKFYPNPTNGIINFESTEDNKIFIVNAIGAVVYSSLISSGTHQINLEDLSKGIYIVTISNINSSKNFKLIKE